MRGKLDTYKELPAWPVLTRLARDEAKGLSGALRILMMAVGVVVWKYFRKRMFIKGGRAFFAKT